MFNLSPGQVAGILSGFATIASAFGLTAVSGTLVNPTTATIVTAIVGTIGAFIAGHLPGKKAVAPASTAS